MSNLFLNPIAAVDTTGASNVATGTTITRSTTVGYGDDTTSFHLSFPGLGTERVRFRRSGLSLTGIALIYANSFKAIGPIGNEIRIWSRIGYSDASITDSATPQQVLSGDWDHVALPVVVADPAKTIASLDVYIERSTTGAWDMNATRITIAESDVAFYRRIRRQLELRPY